MSASPAPPELSAVHRSPVQQEGVIGTHTHRVVSVSPHHVQSMSVPPSPAGTPQEPPVLAAVRESVDTLRTLVGQGRDQTRRLTTVMTSAKQGEAEAMVAVSQLQDRLRVSAQMLKAFQVQISRVEHTLAEVTALERRAEAAEALACKRMEECDARVAAAFDQLDQRISAAVDDAVEKINRHWEQRAADAAARQPGDRAPHTQFTTSRQLELDRLASTMQDIAQQLAHFTSTPTAPPATTSLDLAVQPLRRGPFITVEPKSLGDARTPHTPPRYFQLLACAAD